jgi:hypothetical protein
MLNHASAPFGLLRDVRCVDVLPEFWDRGDAIERRIS